jgi:DNA-binding MarR family transcriptional regulator
MGGSDADPCAKRRAVAGPPSPISEEELRSIALRIPALFAAAKSTGDGPSYEVKELFGAAGLGPRHTNVLRHVMVGGPMSVSALAARLCVALPTASLMVGELSRAGLLERVEDTEDRRRTIVCVAPARLAAVDAFLSRRLGPLRRALERLTAEERAAFARGLDVLTEELSPAGATSDHPIETPQQAGR